TLERAAWTWCARDSRSTASRPWRRWRWGWPSASAPGAGPCATSPASTTRMRMPTRWRAWPVARPAVADAAPLSAAGAGNHLAGQHDPPPIHGGRSMTLYPLFADLAGREVLVVGAGEVAARKIAALLKAGARVR